MTMALQAWPIANSVILQDGFSLQRMLDPISTDMEGGNTRQRTQLSGVLARLLLALLVSSCVFAALFYVYPSRHMFRGVAALTVTNTSNAMMQLSTEPRMRGRVRALRLGVALGDSHRGLAVRLDPQILYGISVCAPDRA